MRLAAGLALALAMAAPVWAAEPEPLDYGRTEHWVCRPDKPGSCDSDLTTTVLESDGSARREPFERAKTPTVDCFYLYPTVSTAPGAMAPPEVSEAERRAVRQQLERLGSLCRLYAPVYRQVTATAMTGGASGGLADAAKVGPQDVAAAWKHYLEHDNHGRGVILVGHSQGAALLTRLMQQEIDGRPLQKHLVSAVLAGAFVTAPTGADVGGTFKQIPACRRNGQTGCVMVFATYRADAPVPAAKAMTFGGGQTPLCTNPAALAGGAGDLKPILSASGETILPQLTAPQPAWTDPPVAIGTPFVALPGLYRAECRNDAHGVWLAVWPELKDGDRRTGALAGDWMVGGVPEDTMGLHLIDLNLTAGNLLDVLAAQVAGYGAKP